MMKLWKWNSKELFIVATLMTFKDVWNRASSEQSMHAWSFMHEAKHVHLNSFNVFS